MAESWRDQTRQAMVGEWKPLECTRVLDAEGETVKEPLRIRPKKLPQTVSDEITQLQSAALLVDDNLHKVKAYDAKMKGLQAEAEAIKEGSAPERILSEAEQADLLAAIPKLPAGMQEKIYDLVLRHGIGEHDFPDGAGGLVGGGKVFDDPTIKEIVEWGSMAAQITAIVLGYSAPLARKPSGKSSASPTGSSIGASSPQ